MAARKNAKTLEELISNYRAAERKKYYQKGRGSKTGTGSGRRPSDYVAFRDQIAAVGDVLIERHLEIALGTYKPKCPEEAAALKDLVRKIVGDAPEKLEIKTVDEFDQIRAIEAEDAADFNATMARKIKDQDKNDS